MTDECSANKNKTTEDGQHCPQTLTSYYLADALQTDSSIEDVAGAWALIAYLAGYE